MIDINDPWVWTKNKQSFVAPLAATITPSVEGAPQNMVLPEQKDPTVEAMKNGVLNEGLRAAEAGVAKDATASQIAGVLGNNAATGAGSQAAMLAEQTAGMGSAGLSATAEAAGAGSQALGPLAAAIGGLAEGKYGKAAGAAAGSAIGNAIVPVIGGYIGSYLGGSFGSMLGFEGGTTNVQPSGGKSIQGDHPRNTTVAAISQLAQRNRDMDMPSNQQATPAAAPFSSAAGGKGMASNQQATPAVASYNTTPGDNLMAGQNYFQWGSQPTPAMPTPATPTPATPTPAMPAPATPTPAQGRASQWRGRDQGGQGRGH